MSMPGPPPTQSELRRRFEAALVRAIATGKPPPTCSGLSYEDILILEAVAAAHTGE